MRVQRGERVCVWERVNWDVKRPFLPLKKVNVCFQRKNDGNKQKRFTVVPDAEFENES